jgi:hypothetical protein
MDRRTEHGALLVADQSGIMLDVLKKYAPNCDVPELTLR